MRMTVVNKHLLDGWHTLVDSLRRPLRRPPRVYKYIWDMWSRHHSEEFEPVDWRYCRTQISHHTSHYHDEQRDLCLLHVVCAVRPPLDVVKSLVQYNPKPKSNGWTPLHIASGKNASLDVIEYLILQQQQQQNGATSTSSIDTPDRDGYTPLHWACRDEISSAVAETLLKHGHDPIATSSSRVEAARQRIFELPRPLDMVLRNIQNAGRLVDESSRDEWKKLKLILRALYNQSLEQQQQTRQTTNYSNNDININNDDAIIWNAALMFCSKESQLDLIYAHLLEQPSTQKTELWQDGGSALARLLSRKPFDDTINDALLRRAFEFYKHDDHQQVSSLLFSLGLSRGWTWCQGMSILANHESLHCRTDDGFFPFQLSRDDVNTTYCLLQSAPDVLREYIPC